jgi:hypothetical protein
LLREEQGKLLRKAESRAVEAEELARLRLEHSQRLLAGASSMRSLA